LAVLVAGPCPDAHLHLQVRPDHTMEVPSLDLTPRANRLEDPTAALLLALGLVHALAQLDDLYRPLAGQWCLQEDHVGVVDVGGGAEPLWSEQVTGVASEHVGALRRHDLPQRVEGQRGLPVDSRSFSATDTVVDARRGEWVP